MSRSIQHHGSPLKYVLDVYMHTLVKNRVVITEVNENKMEQSIINKKPVKR